MIVQPGETSVIAHFVLRDTSGVRMTGVAFNTAGLVAEWRHSDGALWTAITLASGTLGTWESGGFVEDSHGLYQLGLPNVSIPDGIGDIAADYTGLIRLRGVTDMEPAEIRLDARGIPAYKAGTHSSTLGGPGGLPVLTEGATGEGTIIAAKIGLRDSALTSIASAVWSYLKATAAALGTTTFGRYIYDKLALLGTAEGTLNAPLTNGSLLTLYKNGDYKLADNRAIRVTLPAGTFPDITGATCRLGVTKSKDNTGGFVVDASAQSGSAVADQTIDFELDHATETGDLEPAYAYGWTCRIVYPGVDPLTQWDNLDPISGKVKVLEDRVGNEAP